MAFVESIFNVIGDLTWGWALVPILVIFGVFFTLASGLVQFRFFKRMFAVLYAPQPGAEGHISQREALLVSVGGRVGGGNIAGVAVAITLGGPGAVFWMWAIALIGMATSLFECMLAQIYKRSDEDGTYRGGPAQYILHGLGEQYNWLAIVYAVSLIAAFALGFNAFQGNTVAGAMQDSFGIGRVWTGGILAVLTGFVVYGGIRRIAQAADVIVPVMAFGYIGMALLIMLLNITEIPAVLSTIFKNAFGFEQAVGGGMGAAIAQGLRRGLFSNEAGLGSAPNVAAIAYAPHPMAQGIVQSLSVFIDTIVICSCTAFIILLADVYQPGAQNIDGVVLTQQSLVSHVGGWGQYFLSAAILLFAFSSIIYNYYLGENALTVFTEFENVTAHSAYSGHRSGVRRLVCSRRHIGVLLLRSDDGRAGAGQSDRHTHVVPCRDACSEGLRRAVAGRQRDAGLRSAEIPGPRYRSDGVDRGRRRAATA